ncbi:MAG: RNA-processing protein [Candidatus Aenigmarchaeota archaeon]|nr:RNA-processing protein [Candidatus Aenigmarchaeota archaeon]
MIESILVPKRRIRVIMDKNCKIPLEEKLNVKISFNENNVIIEGEGLELYKAKEIIKAIARGFSPVRAFRLLEDNQELRIIDIEPEKRAHIIRSRLIGTKGKTRKSIEEHTKCFMSVYGNTVALIGDYSQIEKARHAIEMIMRGSPHGKVYNYLETL